MQSFRWVWVAILLLLLLPNKSIGQKVPRGITYQAVAIDTRVSSMPGFDMMGQPIPNKTISIRFEILRGSENGEVHYSETHETETDQYGQFTVVIGQGLSDRAEVDSFSQVEWGVHDFYVKVYLDLEGSQDFVHLATQQLMTVPYSFYAEQAGNGIREIETDVKGDHTITYYDGTVIHVAGNDNQTLLLKGDSLSIEDGNALFLPDLDSLNEIQTLSFSGDTLSLSHANLVDLSIYRDLVESLALKVQSDSSFFKHLSDSLAIKVFEDSVYFKILHNGVRAKMLNDSLHFEIDIQSANSRITTDSLLFDSLFRLTWQKQYVDSLKFDQTDKDLLARINRDSAYFNTYNLWQDSRILSDSLHFESLNSSVVARLMADSLFFSSEVNRLSTKIGADSTFLNTLINRNTSSLFRDSSLFRLLIARNASNTYSDSLYFSQWVKTLESRVVNDSLLLKLVETQLINKIQIDSLAFSQTVNHILTSQSSDSIYFQGIADRQQKTIDSLVTEIAKDLDRSATNELQKISLSSNSLSLDKSGGSVDLSSYLDNTDQQNIGSSKTGNNVSMTISSGSGTRFSVADADSSTSNELQTLTKSGDNISLSNSGGTVSLKEYRDSINAHNTRIKNLGDSITHITNNLTIIHQNQDGDSLYFEGRLADDHDTSVLNELQVLSKSGDNVSLSNSGGTVSLKEYRDSINAHNTRIKNLGDSITQITNNISIIHQNQDIDSLYFEGRLADDHDTSAVNELQVLSKSGDNISLSNSGGTVSLKEYRDSINAHNTRIKNLGDSITQITNNLTIIHQNQDGDSLYFEGRLADDHDTSATNELQALSISNDTIFLSNGGFVKLPLSIAQGSTMIQDADGDTKIETEKNIDEDIVRIQLAGTEFLRLERGRFNMPNMAFNTFLGDSAGFSDDLIGNKRNTLIGFSAGKFNTTGYFNNAFGSNALYRNTNGRFNSAFGNSALYQNRTGSFNTAIGIQALQENSSGIGNVGIGNGSGELNESGSFNTSIGLASNSNSFGSYNVTLGARSGGVNSNHSKNGVIHIGYMAGYADTTDNKLYIHNDSSSNPLIYGEFDNRLLNIGGQLKINNAYTLPKVDGSIGQVLSTNGSGTLSWTTPSSGSSSSNSDTAQHVNFSPTPIGGSANAISSVVTIDLNSQGLGAPLYITNSGTYKTTDADDGTTMPCVALALETGIGNKRVVFYGFITNSSWSWTVGQRIYVHTNTGEMTQSPPSGTADYVQVVGFATSATTMMFNPDMTLIKLK